MAGWNFADAWEVVAGCIPDAPALVTDEHVVTWAEFDRRANGVARLLLERGAEQQQSVAQYLYNCPEYLETSFAAFKAGLIPVNTNYRYTGTELAYLWDNADAVAVVFHGAFADRCAEVITAGTRVHTWLWVDDGSGPCPEWAMPYETGASQPDVGRTLAPWGRSGDDLHLMYTGGTTGSPKGVMWRQHDQLLIVDNVGKVRLPEEPDLDALRARTTGPGPRNLAAAPLMHATALLNGFTNLMVGGSVVTLSDRSYSAPRILETIGRQRIGSMAISGDVFAKPMVDELDAHPDRYDFSPMRVITSSGVTLSRETKLRLLAHNPRLTIVDGMGSTEAFGVAVEISTAAATPPPTASFKLRPGSRVITEDGRDVVPGSGERGLIAQTGRLPVGYYKDPVKSAETFPVIDGVRYTVAGDWATIDADGSLRLLGRGNQCINTGGEKVFPEEVEEALKSHPAVVDAAVVGVPDERFGQRIVAIVVAADASADDRPAVEPSPALPGAELGVPFTVDHRSDPRVPFDESAVIAQARSLIAGYKLPRRVIVVDTLGRSDSGKLDYRRLTDLAIAAVG